MNNSKLKKLLRLWHTNELITESQVNNILEFMKERQKELFFRLLKWFMIIGTFWLVFGLIATIINIFELDIFHKIFVVLLKFIGHIIKFVYMYIIMPIHNYIIHPICSFINKIFGEKRYNFYAGTFALFTSILFIIYSMKIKPDKKIDKLNLSNEQKNILKTNWTIDILSCITLTTTFMSYNMILEPSNAYYADTKIIPIWNIIGAITFILMAYSFKKNLYLIFGIYFISLSVGLFTGTSHACYWIGASQPVIQIFVSIILLLVGYITQLHSNIQDGNDNYLQETFVRTYNWTGLLMLFTALWISSFWGFSSEGYSSSTEIWIANIIFIIFSIASMFVGVKTEQKIFFNYGLVFLIIETYTILCGRLWEHLPIGIASLLLGTLLIGTGKILQRMYLKKM